MLFSIARWKKPDPIFYKINTDANLSEDNIWGLATICRDENGEVLASATWRKNGFIDLAVAEAYGLYMALEFAIRCEFLEVIFESNNEKVIRVLNGMNEIPNLYVGNIIMGIKLFSHVGRKGNGAAH